MKLNQHFKQFHYNIRLKKKRLERISSALSHLEEIVDNDDELSKLKVDFLLQGSVAIDMATIPIKDGTEFDADAVGVFDLFKRPYDQQDPQSVIIWFADRLRRNETIKPKVQRRPRCVRINYEGDFHLDIVISHGDKKGPVYVPVREGDKWKWKLSDPRRYIDWVTDVDRELYDGKFCRIMKMLKHWRNLKMGKETSIKSILFTTLVGYQIKCGEASRRASDAEALVEVMEALNTCLKSFNTKPQVLNPSLQSEDLAERWDDDHFRIFKEKFDWATQKARQALDERDKDKSIELWQDIFGANYFPKTLEGAAKVVEAVSAGGAYVSSTGQVSIGKPQDEKGVLIPRHRSFGR